MSDEIMNSSGEIGHSEGSLISDGVFTIISIPSNKVRAGSGVFRGPLQYSFTGGNAEGFDSGSIMTIVTQVINPTALKTRVESFAPLRLGDSGIMVAQGLVSGSPTPISGLVEIIDAGQDKVRAK